MRDLVYYVAISIDGYIAEPDGSFDRFVWDEEFVKEFLASYAWFDTVLMGRKTYEVAFNQGITDPYPNLEGFVYSTTMKGDPDPNVKLIAGDVVSHVKSLKQLEGKPIWLCGGGNLAAQLFDAGLIDRLIIKLNPIVLGKGIPLFSGDVGFARLTLTEVKEYDSGISVRHYDVAYG